MKKKIKVGLIGYGFMGRTHSNAYCKVNHFFDVPYEPALKVVCGLEADVAQAFADNWGYQSSAYRTTSMRRLLSRRRRRVRRSCAKSRWH